MTVVNVLSASYPSVTETIFNQASYGDFANQVLRETSYQDNLEQVFKDLPRARFISGNGKGIDDFISDWVQSPSPTFTQGNMTAAIFDVILGHYILKHQGDSQDFDIAEYMTHKKAVSFAYYDKEGVACAVAWSYSENNPSLWTAAIIRNTVAAPAEREVLVLASPTLLPSKGQALDIADAHLKFLEYLNSEDIAVLSKSIFSDNAELDVQALSALSDFVEEQGVVPHDHAMLLNQRMQFEALVLEKQAQAQEIDLARKRHLGLVHDADLAWASERGFMRRNLANVVLLGLSLLVLASLLPFFSGALLLALIPAVLGAGLFMIVQDESNLTQYQTMQVGINQAAVARLNELEAHFEGHCRKCLMDAHDTDSDVDDFANAMLKLDALVDDAPELAAAERQLSRIPSLSSCPILADTDVIDPVAQSFQFN